MSAHGPIIDTVGHHHGHGQHVMVTAKLDTETDQTYGVRLARLGSIKNGANLASR